jgi:aryl-alcohol dehydrogenase-like predicted oxidoreductase
VELRPFGRTGIDVPAVGMGTWQTFDATSPRDVARCRDVVDAAIAAGTTLFDTSPMYGQAERVLAQALGDRRPAVLVADKVWSSSRVEAREQIERAFDWYGGSVDIYQVHNLLAWEKHIPILQELRDHRSVRAIGATHYKHSALKELVSLMRSGTIQMIQVPYNAGDRGIERHILPLAQELGLGVIIMKPLGSGTLVGRTPPARDLEPLAEFGVHTWAQALLKWILSDPRVHCVIPATSRPDRAAENAAAGDPPWFDPQTRAYVAKLAGRTG